MSNDTIYNAVTAQVIDLLIEGTVPWQKPWIGSTLPTSLSTGRPYRGLNPFILSLTAQANGWTSPYWGTYGQLAKRADMFEVKRGLSSKWVSPDGDDTPRGVRKGEKGTFVHFWKRMVVKAKTPDEQDKTIMLLKVFKVFNADQAENVKLPETVKLPGEAHTPIEACESVVSGYIANGGPSLGFGGDSAYYDRSVDHVQVPNLVAFESPERYYSALFHELTHSTGHKSRIDREGIAGIHRFGDENYSKEELIAEMGAAMLCGVTGIEQATVGQSASYIASWINALKGDVKLAVLAASAAQRACDRILDTRFEIEGDES